MPECRLLDPGKKGFSKIGIEEICKKVVIMSRISPKLIKCLSLGFEVIGMVIAGLFLGRVIGEGFGYKNLGSGVGTLVGFTVWVLHILFLTKSQDDSKK